MPDARPNSVAIPLEGSTWIAPPSKPFRFNLRTALLAMAAIAVIFGFGRVIYLRAEADRLAATCSNEMKEIGLGVLNHADAMGYLPSDNVTDATGADLSSWRFRIFFTFFEWRSWRPNLDYRAPWNAPANRLPARERPATYCWDRASANPHTSVFGIRGPDTVFDGNRRAARDVPVDVIVVIEVRDSKTHWMQPGDYNVTDLLAYRGKIGDHLHGLLPDRVHVLFADGTVWALDPDAPIADLQPFLTITGAKSHDRDQLLGPHKVD
jgi:hypothetical protein